MANANDIRRGNAIRYNGDICMVLEKERVKPGKGGAFVQTVLRNLRTGRTSQTRFASNETVEVVPLIRKKLEYSYRDGSGYIFMDTETYDQITIPAELVDPFKDFDSFSFLDKKWYFKFQTGLQFDRFAHVGRAISP